MGRQEKLKQQRRQQGPASLNEWQVMIAQARQKWLGKTVQLSLQAGYGLVYGKVVSISNDGDVVVEALPGQVGPFAGAMMSLGYIDRMLTLVD
jgi:hypothetical protein